MDKPKVEFEGGRHDFVSATPVAVEATTTIRLREWLDVQEKCADAQRFAELLRAERDSLQAERDELRALLAKREPQAALDAIAHAQDARSAMCALIAREGSNTVGIDGIVTQAMVFADAMQEARQSIRRAREG